MKFKTIGSAFMATILSVITVISPMVVYAEDIKENITEDKPYVINLELTKEDIQEINNYKLRTKDSSSKIEIYGEYLDNIVKNKECLDVVELDGSLVIDLDVNDEINKNNPENKIGSSGFNLIGVDIALTLDKDTIARADDELVGLLTEKDIDKAREDGKKINITISSEEDKYEVTPFLDQLGGTNIKYHSYCTQYLYKYENISGSGTSKQKQNYYLGVIEWPKNDLNSGFVNTKKYDVNLNDAIVLAWNQGSQNNHSSNVLTTHFNAPYLTTQNFSHWSRLSVTSEPTYTVGYKINNWYSSKPLQRAQITAYTGWWYPNNVSDNPSVVFTYNNRYNSAQLTSIGLSKSGMSLSFKPSVSNDDIGQVAGTVPKN